MPPRVKLSSVLDFFANQSYQQAPDLAWILSSFKLVYVLIILNHLACDGRTTLVYSQIMFFLPQTHLHPVYLQQITERIAHGQIPQNKPSDSVLPFSSERFATVSTFLSGSGLWSNFGQLFQDKEV